MMKRFLTMTALCLAMSACGSDEQQTVEKAPDHVSGEALQTLVTTLASDEWEGREAGTPGYDKAAVYVAENYQRIGLAPAGTEGTYFQPIVFQDTRVVEGSAQVILRGAGDPVLLQYLSDYYVILNAGVQNPDVTAPVVFASYGMVAPDFGLNDYEGLDVEGKLVAVLSGLPEGLPAEEGAVLSSLDNKAANALAAGAKGLVLLYTDQSEEMRPFAPRAERSRKGRKSWLDDDGAPYSALGDLEVIIRLSPDAGTMLFDGAAHSYADVRAGAAENTPLPGFDLSPSLTIRYLQETETSVSSNVIGKLPATAETPVGEAVMIVAHLDHLGRGKAVDGDDIYNGALDNALGVASIIEAASAIAKLPELRKRDVYFAALTAEEAGLLGAEYLARHLPLDAAALTGVLNIDMPVALYPFAAVHASGAVHSDLGAVAKSAAQRYGLTVEPDPMPEETFFIRSDHYAFVERGIPSIYLNVGIKAAPQSGVDGLEQVNSFLEAHYHKPSDEVDLPVDWSAAARFADVHVEMLRALMNTEQNIEWAPESFFNQPRVID